MKNTTINNMGTGEQVVRIALGLVLIYSAVLQPGVLGFASLLPLVAIYPVLTGIIRWDPVYYAFSRLKSRMAKKGVKTAEIAPA